MNLNIGKAIDQEDRLIKFFASNALFIYIKNNPAVEKENPTGKFVSQIYELINTIYKTERTLENYFYLVSYATLTDKQNLLSIEDKESLQVKNLFDFVLDFFIGLSFTTKKKEEQRERTLENLKARLNDVQKEENISSHKEIYNIVALSNLVSLAEDFHQYLLTGEDINIKEKIDNKTANAVRFFADTSHRQGELIFNLLKFVLYKHYENRKGND